jgi:hypothetical protein
MTSITHFQPKPKPGGHLPYIPQIHNKIESCLTFQSGNCFSDDGLCPNYLSRKPSSECQKYINSLGSHGTRRTQTQIDEVNKFDAAKIEICKDPKYRNTSACSCLARADTKTKWYNGFFGFLGYRKASKLTDAIGVTVADNCWYKPCRGLGVSQFAMQTEVEKDRSMCSTNCINVIGSYDNSNQQISNAVQTCSSKKPSQQINPRVFWAALIAILILIMIFRR